RFAARLELLQPANLLLHRLEVGEEAAQPPLGDEHRAAALRFVLDDVDELPLGADEENVVAAENHFPRQLLRQIELAKRLLQIDDVNPVALGEDEAAHFRVPTTRLVSEVDTGFQKLIQIGL